MLESLDISGLRRADDPELVAWVAAGFFGGSPPVVDPPVNTAPPAITGNPTRGSILTRTPGTWAGADSVLARWRRNGVVIPGEVGLTYAIPGEALDADAFDVLETATNGDGSATAASNAIVAQVVTIGGKGFPGETLTAGGGAGAYQWRKGSVAIPGATASTYVQQFDDGNGVLACVRGGVTSVNSITCFHPDDVPAVFSYRDAGIVNLALNAVGPDTPANNGQTVRQWKDAMLGASADQTTGANQPTLVSAAVAPLSPLAGMSPAIQFDGTNDAMALGATESNKFIGNAYNYVIVAVKDSNPTGGAVGHFPFFMACSTPGAAVGFSIGTGGSNVAAQIFRAVARQATADAVGTSGSVHDSNWHVLAAEINYAAGTVTLYVDGIAQTPAPLANIGVAAYQANSPATIGNVPSGTNALPGQIAMLILAGGATRMAADDFKRLQAYAGRRIGINIPLP